jgi:putative aminopeptidase FrvX
MHREGILMRSKDLAFLRQLVEAPSPSGYEQPAAAVFREWLKPHADEIETNVMGSVHALLKAKGKAAVPTVMLAGHIDEIGLMVNYISAEGFISCAGIGGVDANVLPGTRVNVHTRDGVLLGLIGRKPIHLLEEDERKAAPKLDKLFVDIGFGGEEAKKRVRVGDPITFAEGLQEYGEGLAVSRAFDDKMGAWISAMVLADVKKAGGAAVNLVAAGTVQEEVGLRGGTTSAYGVNPEIGIAVEVGHATDYPDIDKRKHGEADLGGGPIIARGPNINPVLFDLFIEAAEKSKVPYVIGAEPRGTGTDANAIQLSRGGKAAGLISIPLRYMHTQNEVLSLKDLEAAVKLLTRFVLDLAPGVDFTPR